MPHGKHAGTRSIAMLSVLASPELIEHVETPHLPAERSQARHAHLGCLQTLGGSAHDPRATCETSAFERGAPPVRDPHGPVRTGVPIALSLRPCSHLIARHLLPRLRNTGYPLRCSGGALKPLQVASTPPQPRAPEVPEVKVCSVAPPNHTKGRDHPTTCPIGEILPFPGVVLIALVLMGEAKCACPAYFLLFFAGALRYK